ncbi:hypothetical protein Bca4012_068175 [Brassica carinata]
MPRPGPRPYECVKRAWHSDRHQPIRGSIIRQIFRLAMEAHSAATRKNKEWQEKLPVVVLKAEEIMYSKATSEEEYTDADTMWNRANDAIDTIIRRDESTETGILLPPCVEAALNLGCIAVKASRSQRHSNVRTYLSPKFQQPVSASASEQMQVHQKPLARTLGACTAPAPSPVPINLGLVYPLYHGGNNQTQQVDMSSRVPETPIFMGMPISIKAPEERTERFCDLSLRLGVSSDPPSTRIDVGSSRAYRGRNQEELPLFSKHDSFSN